MSLTLHTLQTGLYVFSTRFTSRINMKLHTHIIRNTGLQNEVSHCSELRCTEYSQSTLYSDT